MSSQPRMLTGLVGVSPWQKRGLEPGTGARRAPVWLVLCTGSKELLRGRWGHRGLRSRGTCSALWAGSEGTGPTWQTPNLGTLPHAPA